MGTSGGHRLAQGPKETGWHGDLGGAPGFGHREAGSEALLGKTRLLAPCCVAAVLAHEVVAAGSPLSSPCSLKCLVCLFLKFV